MTFDVTLLIPNVRKLAAENPDHVYQPLDSFKGPQGGPSCQYVHGDVGGCIVGQAALLSGMGLGELREHDNDDEDTSVSIQFSEYGLSSDELFWLSRVQHHQDTNIPWGRAVTLADEDDLKRAVGK